MQLLQSRKKKNQAYPVQALLFSGFLFATAKVASITVKNYFHIILLPVVHIYDFHIFITSLLELAAN